MAHAYPALEDRVGGGAGRGHSHLNLPGGGEAGIQSLEELEINAALRRQIEGAISGQGNRAMRREIGGFTGQVQLLDAQHLISQGKPDGALIVKLDVSEVGLEGAEVRHQGETARLTQGTAHLYVTADGGVSSDASGKVGAQD